MARSKQSATRPTAYSYQRFSSPSQAEGDSMRRQTELRDAWIAKANAVLDKSIKLTDAGVSAFSGAHRENPERNALAAFLELVKRGRIPRGSYLILESLDRLTREHIRPALTLLLNLIDAGIRIVQLLPVETVYDEDAEPMTLMVAIMELSRGHSESRMKSERLQRAWQNNRRRAVEEGRPMTRATPAWVRVEEGKFVLIPDRAAAVRRVFALAVAGNGLAAITKRLNSEAVPPIGRAPHWVRSYVAKILANRAAFGEYQPHVGHTTRKPHGSPIANYFPAVISEDDWHAAQAALAGRRLRGGRPSKRVAIFSGLLRDARDGGPLHQVNKGTKSGGPALVSYKAAQGIKGSKYVGFPLDTFERAVLSRLREIDPKELLPEHDAADDRVAILEGKHNELHARVSEIQTQLIKGGDLAPLVAVLRTVEADRVRVLEELAMARREASSPLTVAWGEARSILDALDTAEDQADARTRLRAALRRIVEEIRCLFVRRGAVRLAAIQLRFAGGSAERLFLIAHRSGHGSQSNIRKPAAWQVFSTAATPKPGTIDLRQASDVAAIERFLSKLDVSKLAN